MDINNDRPLSYAPEKTLFLGTVTTAMNMNTDEFLSLTIVDGRGEVLFDELLKPAKHTKWSKRNPIKKAMLADAKKFCSYKTELKPYFDGSYYLVSYNLEADLKALEVEGIDVSGCKSYNLLGAYTRYRGTWSDIMQQYHYIALPDCAKHYGYSCTLKNTASAAQATRDVFYALTSDEKFYQHLDREISAEEARIADEATRHREETPEEKRSTVRSLITIVVAVVVVVLVLSFGTSLFT